MTHNVVTLARTPQADEQARNWVVRIDAGPLSADERADLQSWLAEDVRNARLLDKHALLWAAASRASFEAPASAPVRPAYAPPRPWLPAAGAIAAVMLLAVFWVGVPQGTLVQERVSSSVHVTKVGERKTIPLPDGSHTQLNAASTLRVEFSARHRRVLLERGEGLFEVAKDASRPFEVLVGDSVVRAVGTRFFVQRHEDGRVEVAVYEGVVEVVKRSAAMNADAKADPAAIPQPMRLGVGQTAISAANRTLVSVAEPLALERKLAWQRDRIVFDRTPLADAVEDVNRYSSRPIRIGDASLGAIQVSGSFSTQDADVFLRSLEKGFAVRVQSDSQGWLLLPAEQR